MYITYLLDFFGVAKRLKTMTFLQQKNMNLSMIERLDPDDKKTHPETAKAG